jgi:putative ABC transport system permease protein
MWRTTWKGLLAHKLRLTLTALAIVLGVGFVAGTLVLTDTMRSVFDDLFAGTLEGIDVSVRSVAAFTDAQMGFDREPIPADLLEDVAAVGGVRIAEGYVEGYAQLVAPDGTPIQPQGAPTLGYSWTHEDINPMEVREGRSPGAAGEVLVDARTAADHELAVGDEVTAITVTGPDTYEVVGIGGFGDADNLAGATVTMFELDTAQAAFDLEGEYTAIDVASVDGVSATELRDRVSGVLPDGYEAVTATDAAAEMSAAVGEALGFFTTALLIFGVVALFVGAFIIANTFAIVVAQRTREFALLRALGATGRQIVRSVLAEAAIVGAVASAAGIGAGMLLALGLYELLDAFGISLPAGDLVVAPRTIIVALAVGLVVTVVSALLPARRAAAVAPVEAMRSVTTPVIPRSGRRTTIGVALTALGAGLLLLGLSGQVGNAPTWVGVAALTTFIGVAMVAPIFVRPLAAVIGAPAARIGTPGALARGNAVRSPRRTASTAAALMIGLALVAFVAVLAASLRTSMTAIVEEEMRADFIVATDRPQFAWLQPGVADDLRDRDEIAVASAMRMGLARHEGSTVWPVAIDPSTFPETVSFEIVGGDLADLDDEAVALDARTAEDDGLSVGDPYVLEFARTGEHEWPIVAIYENAGIMEGGPVISLGAHGANFGENLDMYVFVVGASAAPTDAVRHAVEDVAEQHPNATVRDQAEFRDEQIGQIDQLLGLVTALLGMAILIAMLGITNTLALSVFERTREIGLLRAVGMTRRQARSMIRWEAMIVAVIGALLGVAVGIFFGWAIVRALADQGIEHLSVPGGQLVGYVMAAAIAGVLAGVLPARRAARLDVLEAIATE